MALTGGGPPIEAVIETDVALAAGGDSSAFERLYRTHVARIHSLARRMLGPGEADEATQDIFVRTWQKLDQFRGESAFGTWLHRLAVNVVIERRRSSGCSGTAGNPPRPHDHSAGLQPRVRRPEGLRHDRPGLAPQPASDVLSTFQ